MKKRYTLILEFEAEINGTVSNRIIKKGYYEKLFKAVKKSEQSILNFYRNLVVSDLLSDCHIYSIKKDINILKRKRDDEIIREVLRFLPGAVKNYFLQVLESCDERTDIFLENFFEQFGNLTVIDARFKEKKVIEKS